MISLKKNCALLMFLAFSVFATTKSPFEDMANGVPVRKAGFSPDGNKIVASYYTDAEDDLKVWDRVQGDLLYATTGTGDYIESVAFTADGITLITASLDIQVREASSGEIFYSLRDEESVYGVSAQLSFDGKTLVTSGNTPKIWDIENRQILFGLRGHCLPTAYANFSPDGQWVYSADSSGTLKLWKASTGEHYKSLYGREEWSTISYCRSRKADDRLPFWSHHVSFSPDSRLLATTADDNMARIWDIATGEQMFSITHKDWVRFAIFSPDGQKIFTASTDLSAAMWDATNGVFIRNIIEGDNIYFAQFSPDGSKIITAETLGFNAAPKVFDTRTGELLFTLKGADWDGPIEFSPDGKTIITSHGDLILVWDASNGDLDLVLD